MSILKIGSVNNFEIRTRLHKTLSKEFQALQT
jgi:hypothetical protein